MNDEQVLDALIEGMVTMEGLNKIALYRVMSTLEDTFFVPVGFSDRIVLKSSHYVNGDTASLLRSIEGRIALTPKFIFHDYHLIIEFTSIQQLVAFCKEFDITVV